MAITHKIEAVMTLKGKNKLPYQTKYIPTEICCDSLYKKGMNVQFRILLPYSNQQENYVLVGCKSVVCTIFDPYQTSGSFSPLF